MKKAWVVIKWFFETTVDFWAVIFIVTWILSLFSTGTFFTVSQVSDKHDTQVWAWYLFKISSVISILGLIVLIASGLKSWYDKNKHTLAADLQRYERQRTEKIKEREKAQKQNGQLSAAPDIDDGKISLLKD